VSQLWEAETQLRNTLREQVDLSHKTLNAQVERETESGGRGVSSHLSPRASREGTAREAYPLVDVCAAPSQAPSTSAQPACVPGYPFAILQAAINRIHCDAVAALNCVVSSRMRAVRTPNSNQSPPPAPDFFAQKGEPLAYGDGYQN